MTWKLLSRKSNDAHCILSANRLWAEPKIWIWNHKKRVENSSGTFLVSVAYPNSIYIVPKCLCVRVPMCVCVWVHSSQSVSHCKVRITLQCAILVLHHIERFIFNPLTAHFDFLAHLGGLHANFDWPRRILKVRRCYKYQNDPHSPNKVYIHKQ